WAPAATLPPLTGSSAETAVLVIDRSAIREPTVAVTVPVDDPPPVLCVAVARLVNTFPGVADEASRTTSVKVAVLPTANEPVMVQLMRPAASVAGGVQLQPLG